MTKKGDHGNSHPMGRAGFSEEMAAAVAFLALECWLLRNFVSLR
ncbi:hypothetical protein [Nostoc sp. NMS4]|nr:hypothetical protein [Nostoc sp. NMS4]